MLNGDNPLITAPSLRLIFVLWGFGYVLVDIFAALGGRSTPGVMFITNVPLYGLAICQSVALIGLMNWTTRLWPILRWPLLLLAVVGAGALQMLIDLNYLRFLAMTVLPSWQDWALSLAPQRMGTVGLLYVWTFVLALCLVWASRVNDLSRLNAARAAAFEAATLRAEASALRLQLNPHFLLNTLNSIASLTVTGREAKAETMINQLAGFLRSSLASDPMAMLPLREEIATALAYLRIEATRFGDRVDVQVDVDPRVEETPAPNFILQPLVENAVKYGVSVHRRPVTLAISARREGAKVVVSITNRTHAGGAPPVTSPSALSSHGLGLRNVSQRLELAYGGNAGLDTRVLTDGFVAEITLPGPFDLQRAQASG